jgi:predicted phosphodiesterase
MRIAYTSDVHTDAGPANAALLPALARRARALRPDVLVIAGDVAERAAQVESTLAHFTSIAARRLFVPGNHDLYAEPDWTSFDKLYERLPAVASRAGFECPHMHPIVHEGVGFLGTPGWFDYSLRDPKLDVVVSMEQYRAGIWRSQRAYDRGHMDWRRCKAVDPPALDAQGDEAVVEHLLARLASQRESVAAAHVVLGIVHVLPAPGLAPPHAFGPSAFHEAWLGSEKFGALLQEDPRLQVILTGHLHRALDTHVGTIRILSSPVGRRRDSDADLDQVAAQCIGLLEVA